MRILVLTDIHANLNALKAVFKKLPQIKPDLIISLGDQINYGPFPRETLALLRDEKVFMLMGNHEERFERLRLKNDPSLLTYNWNLLHFTFAQLKGEAFHLPKQLHFGRYFFTHSVPGDLFKIIEADQLSEFSAIAKQLPSGVDAYFSGHNHLAWKVETDGVTFFNSGSTGCFEGGQGCMAGWHLIDDRGHVETHLTPYDIAGLKEAFVSTGAAQMAPEFSALVMHQMVTGEHKTFPEFIKLAFAIEKETGLPWNSKEAFHLAIRSMDLCKMI